jgi:hypothetical protein
MHYNECNKRDEQIIPGNELSLAMAYVPWQKWRKVSCANKGLADGTIFEELIFPFIPSQGCNTCGRRGDRR